MTDVDVELARRETEATQDESNLHSELTRLLAVQTDYERRIKQLKAAVAEAERQGACDGHLAQRAGALRLPALDPEARFEPARALRRQALEARRHAAEQVREDVKRFRAEVQQLGQTLSADEKLVQRLLAQAKQMKAAPPPPADDDGLGATMISAARPPDVPAKPRQVLGAMKPVPKRQSPRVRMQAQVDFESDDNFFNGFSSNISDGGLFIATVNLLPLGTNVDLAFTLPTGERIECKGEVRWVREVDDRQPEVMPGMGVQFVGLDPSAARAIESFIQQRDPLFYVD